MCPAYSDSHDYNNDCVRACVCGGGGGLGTVMSDLGTIITLKDNNRSEQITHVGMSHAIDKLIRFATHANCP